MPTDDIKALDAFTNGLRNDALGPRFIVGPSSNYAPAYAALASIKNDLLDDPRNAGNNLYKLHDGTLADVAKLMDPSDLNRLADASITDATVRNNTAAASYIGQLFRQAQVPKGVLDSVGARTDPLDIRAAALGDLMKRAGTTSFDSLRSTVELANRYSDKSRYGLTLATEANMRDKLDRLGQVAKDVGAKSATDLAERLKKIEDKAADPQGGRDAVKLLLDDTAKKDIADVEKFVADAGNEVDSRGKPIDNTHGR